MDQAVVVLNVTFFTGSIRMSNVMEQSLLDEKSYYMKGYRAKAYYSLDYGNGIENYVIFHEETPEEVYERKLTIR